MLILSPFVFGVAHHCRFWVLHENTEQILFWFLLSIYWSKQNTDKILIYVFTKIINTEIFTALWPWSTNVTASSLANCRLACWGSIGSTAAICVITLDINKSSMIQQKNSTLSNYVCIKQSQQVKMAVFRPFCRMSNTSSLLMWHLQSESLQWRAPASGDMVIQTSTVPLLTGFVFNLFSVASIALSTHFFSLFHKGGQLRTCFSEASVKLRGRES